MVVCSEKIFTELMEKGAPIVVYRINENPSDE